MNESLGDLTDTDLAESGNVQKSFDWGGGGFPAGGEGKFFRGALCPKVGGFGTKLALF
jgi:hypothetical protein